MKELDKYDELKSFISDYNPGHDDTQIQHFIVGNNHTDYGCYKQAIAETHSNYEALKQSYIAVQKNEAEIKILEAEIEEMETLGDKVSLAKVGLKVVEIREKQLGNETLQKQIARNTNELEKMFALAKVYGKKIEGKDKVVLEKEYHVARLGKLLALNTVFKGGNLSGVMDVVTTLPDDMQKPLLDEYNALLVTDSNNKKLLGVGM
jgi:hypothetical protein